MFKSTVSTKNSENTRNRVKFSTEMGEKSSSIQKRTFKLKIQKTVENFEDFSFIVPTESDKKTNGKALIYINQTIKPKLSFNFQFSSSTHIRKGSLQNVPVSVTQKESDGHLVTSARPFWERPKDVNSTIQRSITPVSVVNGPRAHSVSIEPRSGDDCGSIRSIKVQKINPHKLVTPSAMESDSKESKPNKGVHSDFMARLNFSYLLSGKEKIIQNTRRKFYKDGVEQEIVCLIWEDGTQYEGSIIDHKFHGYGKLFVATGYTIKGYFIKGNIEGHAEYRMGGKSYIGEWMENMPHGRGIEKVEGSYTYEGDFWSGIKFGKGKMVIFSKGTYEGEFRDNCFHGSGKFVWTDGRKYIGVWFRNHMHGKGMMTWPDGRKYVGRYMKSKKEGFGVFTWADGRVFSGIWKGGKQEGTGKYIPLNGRKQDGEWKNGKCSVLPNQMY